MSPQKSTIINPLAPNNAHDTLQGTGFHSRTLQYMHRPNMAILVKTCWGFSLCFWLLCVCVCVCKTSHEKIKSWHSSDCIRNLFWCQRVKIPYYVVQEYMPMTANRHCYQSHSPLCMWSSPLTFIQLSQLKFLQSSLTFWGKLLSQNFMYLLLHIKPPRSQTETETEKEWNNNDFTFYWVHHY